MSRWLDVSVALHNDVVHWPGDQPFVIRQSSKMSDGAEYNLSQFATSAHMGTHMDAPLHFVDRAASIDEMPLEAAIGPARVVTFADQITVAELERHQVRAGERILFRTKNSDTGWPSKGFMEEFIAIPEESAKWLAERRPALVGVDYLSIGPFDNSGPTHRAILSAGIWVIEGLDLSGIAPGEYEMVCLPLKLRGAEGSPARVALRPI